MGESAWTRLIGPALGGDEQAVADLWTAYEGRLRRFFKSRKAREDDVGDLVQETILRVMRALRKRKIPTDSAEAWLFGVAENVHADVARRRCREREREDGVPTEERALAGDAGLEPDRGDLLAKIRKLPEKYREPLLLFHEKGRAYRQIARDLGSNPRTVATWIRRGKLLLRIEGARGRPRT